MLLLYHSVSLFLLCLHSFSIIVIVDLWFLILLRGPLCLVTLSVAPTHITHVTHWSAWRHQADQWVTSSDWPLKPEWRHWSDLRVTSWTARLLAVTVDGLLTCWVTSSADVSNWPFVCIVVLIHRCVDTPHKSPFVLYLILYSLTKELSVLTPVGPRAPLSGLVHEKAKNSPLLVVSDTYRPMMPILRWGVQNNVSTLETFGRDVRAVTTTSSQSSDNV